MPADNELLSRQMPHSLEAEQAALGSMLIDADCIKDVMDKLQPEDFYVQQNREIFETIYTMFSYSKPIDGVTVAEEMQKNGTYDDQTTRSYLVQLMEITPTSANVMEYVAIIRDKALLRGLAKAAGEITFRNLYVNLPENVDVYEFSAAAMNMENVASVQVNSDMLVRFSSMMSSMNYIVFVVIGCAAALAFIVLYNLNNINITERIREIATIKVLGFYRNETSSYVFRENMVLTAMGCGLGLILGKLLHFYVMYQVDIDMISFDVHIKTISYLLSILLTFAFTWIVNRIMAGKLDRINMAESLKSVD